MSWDEEVHFAQAFWMANYGRRCRRNRRFTGVHDGRRYLAVQSAGESGRAGGAHFVSESECGYRHGEHLWSTDSNKTTMTGYVGSALALKAGLLHIPFGILYKLGGWEISMSMRQFCILPSKTPVGKAILAFLGADARADDAGGAYSYDPTVTAFLWLSFAGILEAALGGRKMDWKAYALIVLTFVWGCRVKAVYAPLILLGLMIPAEKFRSKRKCT